MSKHKPRHTKPGQIPPGRFGGVFVAGVAFDANRRPVSLPLYVPRFPDRWVVMRRPGPRLNVRAYDGSVDVIVTSEGRCGYGDQGEQCRTPIGAQWALIGVPTVNLYWSGYGRGRYVDAPTARHEPIAPGDLPADLLHVYPSSAPTLVLDAFCPAHGPRSIDRQLVVEEAKRRTRSGTPKVFPMEANIHGCPSIYVG